MIVLLSPICMYAVPPDFVTITSNLRCRGSECAILTGATGYLECSATGVPTPTVTLTNVTAVSDNVMVSGMPGSPLPMQQQGMSQTSLVMHLTL